MYGLLDLESLLTELGRRIKETNSYKSEFNVNSLRMVVRLTQRVYDGWLYIFRTLLTLIFYTYSKIQNILLSLRIWFCRLGSLKGLNFKLNALYFTFLLPACQQFAWPRWSREQHVKDVAIWGEVFCKFELPCE